MKNQKEKLGNFSAKEFKEKVSEISFWKLTRKIFRTLEEENIISKDVYDHIKKKALEGEITENNLFKSLQKDLSIQAADAHKIIDALKEKLMPAPEDDTSEEDLAKRQEIIRAIIASAYEEEQRKAA